MTCGHIKSPALLIRHFLRRLRKCHLPQWGRLIPTVFSVRFCGSSRTSTLTDCHHNFGTFVGTGVLDRPFCGDICAGFAGEHSSPLRHLRNFPTKFLQKRKNSRKMSYCKIRNNIVQYKCKQCTATKFKFLRRN